MRWYSRWIRHIPSRPRAKSRRRLHIETLESRAMPHVSGTVFLDANGNGLRDAGENGIAEVTVQVFKDETQVRSTQTNTAGLYSFEGLELSTDFQIRIDTTQAKLAELSLVTPDMGDNDAIDSDASLTGTDATVDFTTDAVDSHFAFDAGFAAATGTLTLGDTVFIDADDNGTFDSGESGAAGVTVELLDETGETVLDTTTTDSAGHYTFTGLADGIYQVRLAASNFSGTGPLVGFTPSSAASDIPDDDLDLDSNGTASGTLGSGGFIISGPITLAAGEEPADDGDTSTDTNLSVDFGVVPADTGAGDSIAGRVFLDFDNSGTFEGPDKGIAGVTLTLTGGDLTSPMTVQTDASGNFSFTGLAPGTYTLTETQPTTPANQDGQATAGTSGGTATGNVIDDIVIEEGDTATGYLFSEVPLLSTGGTVFQDTNGNGQLDTGETGIPGVTITLTGTSVVDGAITPKTATTNAQGVYNFTDLTPGTYTIAETQPTGFTDGAEQNGTPAAATVTNDTFTGIDLTSTSAVSSGFNFGETSTTAGTASIGGSVFVDANNDGVRQTGEAGISGVTITLTGGGLTSPQTTTTDSTGAFSFTGLAPGTYTIKETQPTTNPDGTDTAGTAGGNATTTNDTISGITLTADQAATGYLFGEGAATTPTPGSISGSVFVDANNDGVRQTSEAGISGVTITLTGGDLTSPKTTTTDSTGAFSFTGLAAGTYTLKETQPTTNPDGTDTAGNAGGNATATNDTISGIALTAEQAATGYLFGEGAATTAPGGPDVRITQTLSSTRVTPGGTLTITYTVRNRGTNPVSAVEVAAELGELTFVSASSQDFDDATGTWTVGDLAAGASKTLRVTARVPSASTFHATAQATIAAQGAAPEVSTGVAAGTVVGSAGAPRFWFLSSGWTTMRGVTGGGSGGSSTSTARTPPPTTTGPQTPTLALAPASDTGTAGDNSTTLATVTLNGTTSAGASVTLVETGATATANSSGAFSFASVPLTVGANTFTVRATNSSGTTNGTATITRTSSTGTAPTTPTLTLDPASDTGTAGDNSTSLATVKLIGTTSPSVQVTLVQTSTTVTSDSTGAFSFVDVPLTVGANTFTVRATNSSGTTEGTATITRVSDTPTNATPTVATPPGPVSLTSGNSTTLDLAGTFTDADIANSTVRFNTSAGPINVELFDSQAPRTVANFLNYVTDGDYANSIFHRSAKLEDNITPFVLQGGGFKFNATPTPSITAIPTDPAVQNEPDAANRSNLKGTLAMAKLGGQPNSATDQFFFNLGDNSFLDTNNGGFTVFGKVVGAADQAVVDELAAIPTQDKSTATALPTSIRGAFGEVPLTDYTGTNFPTDTTADNYALITGVSIVNQPEALTYTIESNSTPTVASATISHNRLTIQGLATGTTTLTIKATDKAGASVTTTVTVTVGA